jgi:hypothetical protein
MCVFALGLAMRRDVSDFPNLDGTSYLLLLWLRAPMRRSARGLKGFIHLSSLMSKDLVQQRAQGERVGLLK